MMSIHYATWQLCFKSHCSTDVHWMPVASGLPVTKPESRSSSQLSPAVGCPPWLRCPVPVETSLSLLWAFFLPPWKPGAPLSCHFLADFPRFRINEVSAYPLLCIHLLAKHTSSRPINHQLCFHTSCPASM